MKKKGRLSRKRFNPFKQDVYALGCTVYQTIFGEVPDRNKVESLKDIKVALKDLKKMYTYKTGFLTKVFDKIQSHRQEETDMLDSKEKEFFAENAESLINFLNGALVADPSKRVTAREGLAMLGGDPSEHTHSRTKEELKERVCYHEYT